MADPGAPALLGPRATNPRPLDELRREVNRMVNVLALQELDEEIVVDAPISTISLGGCH
ncbi:hypothetical protein [Streptomyces sp. NPDC021212]|uniref:hypothetical protein n=1 Tax=Streptomyces sp. NPDC021212 TaxID=3365118 RepID=UPI0037884439